jgi:hypothetical protein
VELQSTLLLDKAWLKMKSEIQKQIHEEVSDSVQSKLHSMLDDHSQRIDKKLMFQ